MEDHVARLEPRVARIEADVSQLNARVGNVEVDLRGLRKAMDVMDARFESKLDIQDEWHFPLLLALLSATVTLAATILGVLLSDLHGH